MTVWEARRDGWTKPPGDARSDADIDYGRIIHCASFRRLQGKTQVLNLGDSDFYRNRLTHSLEVAQIATGVARQLRADNPEHPALPFLPDHALIQAIGSTHDLGHPPFGHGGEIALNYCMKSNGGFEGNGQTLRILSRIEKYSPNDGANLTRRTLLGTLKYPVAFSSAMNKHRQPALMDGQSVLKLLDREICKPPKCYMDSEQGVVDWILEPLSQADRDAFVALTPDPQADAGEEEIRKVAHRKALHKSFDCSIMDLSDDIAFGVHDLEDALALSLITKDEFERYVPEKLCGDFLDWRNSTRREGDNDVYGKIVDRLFGDASTRKHAVSILVGYFVHACRIDTLDAFAESLIRYRAKMRPEAKALLGALKDLVYDVVIRSPAVQHLEFKGQQMVVAVFEALASDPKAFLPKGTFAVFEKDDGDIRVICDHIAGMTDQHLLKTYERLFSPRMGSVFDSM